MTLIFNGTGMSMFKKPRLLEVLVHLLVQFLKSVAGAEDSFPMKILIRQMMGQGFAVNVSQKNRFIHRHVHEETERTKVSRACNKSVLRAGWNFMRVEL